MMPRGRLHLIYKPYGYVDHQVTRLRGWMIVHADWVDYQVQIPEY